MRPGRRLAGFRAFACFLVLAGALAGVHVAEVQAMWQRMSDAELLASSALVVDGEWVGQGRVTVAGQTLDLGSVKVVEVLRGSLEGTVAFIAVPAADRPISSSDLRFRRGDRGLWFFKRSPKGDASSPLIVDHPQRFLADLPENAAAIDGWRQRLKRP